MAYADIPHALKSALPAFAASGEYALLRGTADDLPGVVLAAFGRFLTRIALTDPSDILLARGVAMVGELWRYNDAQTRVSIEDEFFEALDLEPDAIPIIVNLMPSQLQSGYSQWAARPF